MSVLHSGPADATGARARVLDAASDLFYREGIRAIGIDTVIERAGVAKASLYRHFRTKDDLAAEVLRQRDERWRRWLTGTVGEQSNASHTKILTVFDALEEWFASEEFRGCGFINAAAEFPDPGHPVRVVANAHKHAVLGYLQELAGETRADDPSDLAAKLFLLVEGATVTAYLERATWPAASAKAAAATLLQASVSRTQG